MIGLFVSLSQRRGRWRFLLVAALAVGALGLWGMRLASDGRTFLDDLYQLRGLFTFGLSLELGNANWQLQIARWLGPLVAAAVLLEGFAALSRRRVDAFQAKRTHGHTVVLGLGDRGTRIALALREAGQDVTAVEIDPGEAGIGILRRRGGRVVEGDARLHHELIDAGLPSAASAVVVCGSDATNAEVVAAIADLDRAPGAGPLNAAVHLSDAGLCALMRHQSLRTATHGVRFDFFDIYSAGARLFLQYHPLAEAVNGAPPHLMIVGLGQFGRCLLEATARAAEGGDIAITVIDRDADARLQAVLLGQESLKDRARIDAVDIDLERPGRDASERLRAALARGVTTVAVCFDDDARAVTAALLIRRLLGVRPVEVIARTSGTGGLSLLLGQGASAAGVTPFPLLERACTREIVEGGAHEQVARAMHADYTDRAIDTPYDVPWDELPPEVQESNRRQADALAEALAAIHCDLVPLGGWGVPDVELTPDEVELLARREHERWFAERFAAGWRYGPERDNEQRLNPLLVAWDDLPAVAQDDGREAARRIPAVLATAGLEVLRLAPAAVSPAAAAG
jgi:Trk K+ transport system NAD-binding subunit